MTNLRHKGWLAGLTVASLLTTSGLTLFGQPQRHAAEDSFPALATSANTFFWKPEAGKEMAMPVDLHTVFGLSADYTFIQAAAETDDLGWAHQSFKQYYKGIPIEDGQVLVHSREGLLKAINGGLSIMDAGFPTAPYYSAEQAYRNAYTHLDFKDIPKNPVIELTIIPTSERTGYILAYKVPVEGFNTSSSTYISAYVFVDAKDGAILHTQSRILHAAVNGVGQTLYSGMQDIVMEQTGTNYRLFDAERNIRTVNFEHATLSADGYVGNLVEYENTSTSWPETLCLDSISVTSVGDSILMRDRRRWLPGVFVQGRVNTPFLTQGPVLTYDRSTAMLPCIGNIGFNLTLPPYQVSVAGYDPINKRHTVLAPFLIDNPNLNEGIYAWSDSLGNKGYYTLRKKPNPALDAHWGMSRSYDYFKDVFGRRGYDKKSGPVTNMINASMLFAGTQNNAAALNAGANGIMVFGLGDRFNMDAVVSLDVVGHEFAHMVVFHNGLGGLVAQGESGALNESFADIFGACIEFKYKGAQANWLVGDEAYLRSPWMYRSMSHPKEHLDPDTYQGQYWINPTNLQNDYGGIHVNNGIQNKWFYLLCQGGSGTNDKGHSYDVSPIGMDKAQQIAYRNLTTYLTPYATFIDAYRGSLQATIDLFGADGTEYTAVTAAWYAVGIDEAAGNSIAPQAKDIPIQLYPNPATDKVFVRYTAGTQQDISLSIKNINGQCVWEQSLKAGAMGGQHWELTTRNLPEGAYLVEISSLTQRSVQKLIIRR